MILKVDQFGAPQLSELPPLPMHIKRVKLTDTVLTFFETYAIRSHLMSVLIIF